MQTRHSTDTLTVKITPNDRGNPAGKLADSKQDLLRSVAIR